MKSFKQLFDMITHEQNLRFRPQWSIGTGVAGNGWVRSCRNNVPRLQGRRGDREETSKTASIKAVRGLDRMASPTQVNCRKHRQS